MRVLTFRPKLISTLRNYNRKTFMADVMAGVIVGIVALPLAIAFGIASGVTPEKGIITAIVAGFIISMAGGSKVQIGGPTGAFIVIIYGIIQQYGMQGLTIATLMAGVFLLLFGLLQLGTIIKFIPYPIIVGFTSGIAVTIFTTQIKDLFGMTIRLHRKVDSLFPEFPHCRHVECFNRCDEHRHNIRHTEIQQEDSRFAHRHNTDDTVCRST